MTSDKFLRAQWFATCRIRANTPDPEVWLRAEIWAKSILRRLGVQAVELELAKVVLIPGEQA